jgi:hypothetical protein
MLTLCFLALLASQKWNAGRRGVSSRATQARREQCSGQYKHIAEHLNRYRYRRECRNRSQSIGQPAIYMPIATPSFFLSLSLFLFACLVSLYLHALIPNALVFFFFFNKLRNYLILFCLCLHLGLLLFWFVGCAEGNSEITHVKGNFCYAYNDRSKQRQKNALVA